MDLPAAITLASEATGSPALLREGREMASRLEAGQPIDAGAVRRGMLPATIPATIQFASGFHDLPMTLESLGEMCQRQAEVRIAAIPAIVTPIFVLVIGLLVSFIILGLFAPMISLFQGMLSP
jgi:type II secretory pathway component PulF